MAAVESGMKEGERTVRNYAAMILRMWAQDHRNLSTGYLRKRHMDEAVRIITAMKKTLVCSDGRKRESISVGDLAKAIKMIGVYLDRDIGIRPDDSNRELFYGQNEMVEHIRMRERESREHREKNSREARMKKAAREALDSAFESEEQDGPSSGL